MIAFHYQRKGRFAGGRAYNWDNGDNPTQTSNQTSTEQTNNYDNRQINTTTVSSYDLSNRSTQNTTNITDSSDRSTNNTSITTLDGGAVSGALGLAGDTLKAGVSQLTNVLGLASQVVTGQNAAQAQGYDFADHLFNHALDSVSGSQEAALNAFDRAAQIQTAAMGQLQGAYADAKGTTAAQQKIMIGVLVLAGVALMARKG
jgi:hypothetical protein